MIDQTKKNTKQVTLNVAQGREESTKPRTLNPKKKISWNIKEEGYQNLRSQSKGIIKETAQSEEGATQTSPKVPNQDS